MAVAGKCQTRNELEQVLGKPKYVLKGDGFCIGSFVPDRVESYQKRGCVIELWFKGERFHSDSGFVPYTAWDIASGLAPDPPGASSNRP